MTSKGAGLKMSETDHLRIATTATERFSGKLRASSQSANGPGMGTPGLRLVGPSTRV